MDWKKLRAYITGSVDQELLLRNEYLVTENRILHSQIKGRVHLSDGEGKTLAEIGKKLGKQALGGSRRLSNPGRFLPGTEGTSPRDLTAPSSARLVAARRSTRS